MKKNSFATALSVLGLIALTFSLSGCGGGSAPADSPIGPPINPSPRYVVWNGNANGSTILDATGHPFAVDATNNTVIDLSTGAVIAGLNVDPSTATISDTTGVIGTVKAVAATGGGTVVVLRCNNPANQDMTLTITPQSWSHNCTTGTGNTGGGTTTPSYVNWSGNANGSTLLDGAGRTLAVRSSDLAVVDRSNNGSTILSGLRIDINNGSISDAGNTVFGSLVSVPAVIGNVLLLRCNSPASLNMILSVSAQGWSHNCGGSASGGGTTTPPSYANWTGNANGTTLIDGSGLSYAVISAPGQSTDRSLIDLSTNKSLSQVTVDTQGQILLANTLIGNANLVTRNNANIVVLQCTPSNGSIIDMVITYSGTGWTHNCAVAQPIASRYLDLTASGNLNGEVIQDASNPIHHFSARLSDNALVDIDNNAVLAGLAVNTSTGALTQNGTALGQISLVAAGTVGTGKVAILMCTDATTRMAISYSATGWTHNCPSSSTTGGTTATDYIVWSGNSTVPNYAVLDAVATHRFAVQSADNLVVDISGAVPVRLLGLTIDTTHPTATTVLKLGNPIGTLVNLGGQIKLQCTNGNPMTLNVSSSSWSFGC
ncbi:MAG: hypothetical protein AB3X46_02675 [Leptothrix ochracea]|uniref:hypothetical protein n=1 Tax=Leptothrix ochracea TaxID=735331 RepID=UPI0034E22929